MTDEIEFNEEPNYAPSIVYEPNDDFAPGNVLWVDIMGMQTNWEFDILIRDNNVDQELVVHQRMVREGTQYPRFTSSMLPPSGSVERRHTVRFSVGDIRQGECQQLQIAVSGSFFDDVDTEQLFDFVRPREDIAYASWTILEGTGEPPVTPEDETRLAHLLDSCPSKEALLMMEPEPGAGP